MHEMQPRCVRRADPPERGRSPGLRMPMRPPMDAKAGVSRAVAAVTLVAAVAALAAAGSTGKVGPSLDDAKPDAAKVIDVVTNGKGVMPSYRNRLDRVQIEHLAAFVSEAH